MDVYGSGEVRCFCVITPIVVGEPRVGCGDGDEVTGAWVVLNADFLDTGGVFEKSTDFLFYRWIVDIDVCDLVIGYGERFAAAGIKGFAAKLVFD